MQIEKGLTIPNFGTPKGKKNKYPWCEMEVGDSVLTEHTDTQHNAIKAANMHGYKKGKKFRTTRENGFLRVWRVA